MNYGNLEGVTNHWYYYSGENYNYKFKPGFEKNDCGKIKRYSCVRTDGQACAQHYDAHNYVTFDEENGKLSVKMNNPHNTKYPPGTYPMQIRACGSNCVDEPYEPVMDFNLQLPCMLEATHFTWPYEVLES